MYRYCRVLVCLALLFSINSSYGQILEDFASKYISTRGGKEKILNLHSVTIQGEMNKGNAKVPITIQIKHGVGYRHEWTFNGKKEIMIMNMNESWKGEDIKSLVKNDDATHQNYLFYIDLRGDFMDMDVSSKYEFIDFEIINNTEYLKINKIDMAKNTNKTLFYSNTTFMKFKETYQNISNGQEDQVLYSNYKKTDFGLLMPYTINLGFGDISVTKYIINPTLERSIFLNESIENNSKNTERLPIKR